MGIRVSVEVTDPEMLHIPPRSLVYARVLGAGAPVLQLTAILPGSGPAKLGAGAGCTVMVREWIIVRWPGWLSGLVESLFF